MWVTLDTFFGLSVSLANALILPERVTLPSDKLLELYYSTIYLQTTDNRPLRFGPLTDLFGSALRFNSRFQLDIVAATTIKDSTTRRMYRVFSARRRQIDAVAELMHELGCEKFQVCGEGWDAAAIYLGYGEKS
jgi:hypothetical protein